MRQDLAVTGPLELPPDEMRRLLNLMVGELNASHLGVSGPFAGAQPTPVGNHGLRFDRAEYENNGRLKITEIIALSPAAVREQRESTSPNGPDPPARLDSPPGGPPHASTTTSFCPSSTGTSASNRPPGSKRAGFPATFTDPASEICPRILSGPPASCD